MNNIVYVADGTRRPYTERAETMGQFMNRRRVSDGKHQMAKAELRAEYQRKAAAVGLTLDAYCARFSIKLYD